MDSFEVNKIAGAVLGALLLTMGLGIVSNGIFAHAKLEKPGYALPGAEVEPAAGKTPAASDAVEVPLPDLLAKADSKKGESLAKACLTCHSFDKGGPAKVGPPLWGVVDRPVASIAGFSYSEAIKGKGGTWTFDAINHFITNPKAYAPGTKMAFGGEKDPGKRADIEAYLRTLSDSPAPLPTK